MDDEMREVMMVASSAVMLEASGGVETEGKEDVVGDDDATTTRRRRRRRRGTPRPLYGKALTKRIKELGDARRLGDVFALLDVSKIPTTPNGRKITIGAVVGACVKCNDLDTAHNLLMKLDGVDECGAGAPAYSTLMLGYARQGRLTEALGLLEQWEKGRGPKDGKFGVGRRGNIILRGSWRWAKEDVPKYKRRDDMGTEWCPCHRVSCTLARPPWPTSTTLAR